MSRSNNITITLPARVYGRLVETADNRHMKIDDVLVAAINEVIDPTPRVEPAFDSRRALIVELAEIGTPDSEISGLLGESLQYVATVRRKAGIYRRPPRTRDNTKRKAA